MEDRKGRIDEGEIEEEEKIGKERRMGWERRTEEDWEGRRGREE
jgi:hypothetical protein